MQTDTSFMARLRFGLGRLSAAIMRAELFMLGTLMFVLFALVMGNVALRMAGRPVIWLDEAAVITMIWVALIGASLGLAQRRHMAITLLPDMLPRRMAARLGMVANLLLLVFFTIFAVILWRWFDPITYLLAESPRAFARQTFNFLYDEPTMTLGIRKFWFWLVLPLFCATGLLHMTAQVLDVAEVEQ